MHRAAFLLALSLVLPGAAATAQDGGTAAAEPSEEEILRAFESQTRGLKIAPAATGTETATGAAAPDTATAAAADAGTTGASVALDAVPREDQVNVNIAFDFDSAALRPDQQPRLAALCSAMKASGDRVFRVLGHTDASGSAAYNENLSLLRAKEVRRYLVNDCGIAAERLVAAGAGERFPFDEADPEAEVNRRVEFQVVG